MHDLGESDLIAGLRAGDDRAYEQLVRRFGGAMLAVARRLMRHEDDARDVVQEAFLHAYRAVDSFRADARLSTWLHRIVVNAALMRLRSMSRRPEQPLDDLLPTFDADGHRTSPVPSLPQGAEELFGRAQLRAHVRACIAELPAQHRAVIVMRDLEELTTAETAIALGITENAAKIRLHRARQALLALLQRRLGAEALRD